MDESKPTLVLDRVTKSFGDFTAVSDLSLQVKPGRVFGLIGPNGAGKTTTIRMIVNITVPDSGRIELLGQRMTTALQDRIGYLPEERGLYRKMKVGEQLRFFAELKDLSGREADARIDKWLRILQLTEWKEKRTKDLSKGMQQKVQFITAVIHDPDLLILDEPFSGLDPVNVDVMKETILELRRANKTIILSTHQMEIAEKLCDDVCMINKSRKVFDGRLRDIRRSFARNAVCVRFEGTDGLLNDPEIVTNIREVGEDFEVLLAPGANAQTLLKRLVDAGVVIRKFELVEPSLHDIFVARVRESA
ncbi:MAG TPA: ATP-binding cassette domain-containing protein [Pyrinomonadaceae bacterium]|jgi:ABC-2 type transport system ATP-binding protein|nr:ATP-binding cassette domain-containing protein [Pyrinomonadaceae bacterium]